jgi:hypothetical protein
MISFSSFSSKCLFLLALSVTLNCGAANLNKLLPVLLTPKPASQRSFAAREAYHAVK